MESSSRATPCAADGRAARWQAPPTLPGADYHADEVFARERERIFHGTWFCVGRAEEAPEAGSLFVVDVAGESVVVVRGEDGLLRAFFNVCRHRGTRLCDEAQRVRKAIVCPYHAWSYGLDGELLGTPNVGREERIRREQLGLVPVPLELLEGFVWLSVGGCATSLHEHLSSAASEDPFQWERYGVGDLVIGARREYDVAANWKIIVENYNECLHCPTVHPELVRVVPLYRHGEVEDASGSNGNRLAEGFTSFTPGGRSGLPRLPGLDEEDAVSFYGVTLLPNLIVNYHSDVVSTFLLLPRGPGETSVVCHYLFRPETVADPGFDPSAVVDFRDLLAQQDWAVCERAQLGVASRAFAAGGVLPYRDRYVHAFHRQYTALRDSSRPAPP